MNLIECIRRVKPGSECVFDSKSINSSISIAVALNGGVFLNIWCHGGSHPLSDKPQLRHYLADDYSQVGNRVEDYPDPAYTSVIID